MATRFACPVFKHQQCPFAVSEHSPLDLRRKRCLIARRKTRQPRSHFPQSVSFSRNKDWVSSLLACTASCRGIKRNERKPPQRIRHRAKDYYQLGMLAGLMHEPLMQLSE